MSRSRTLARLAALVFFVAVVSISAPAGASGDPDLSWWTVETAHFRIHYPREAEPIATRLATVAESIHDRLVPSMGYAPSERTEIVLSDVTDSANGSAIATPYNTVRLFITAPDDMSALGDYDDWYVDLLTHEYTHILHTDNISGLPSVVNAILGKTLSPNRFQPNWVLEGLAVVKESQHTSGGRIRGSAYEMFMRADVVADDIASLDQVSNAPRRWPQRTIWYLYGSRFLQWISDVYGPNTMRAVSADYGSHLIPGDINRTIRRATGRTYVELYEGFKDYLRRRHGATVAAVEKRGLREGVRITHHGRDVSYPRFVPPVARSKAGREELVFFRDDSNQRAGIYRMALGDPKSSQKRDEELLARTAGTSSSAFTPRGDLVFSSVTPFRYSYAWSDLYTIPVGTTAPRGTEAHRRRLSVALRANAADVSPDGRSVAFVVNSLGTSELQIAALDDEGNLVRRRTLVPSARFDQAFTPRFSPDGARVAYSAWNTGGYRDVCIVELATGKVRRVTHDRALDMQPAWSADGRTLYFSSDRTGVSNVYAFELDDGRLRQVTNVRTGAFSPTVSTDGKTLVYLGYTNAGFDLYAMALDPARFLEALPPPDNRPDPPAEPNPVRMRRHPYSPWPTVAPRNFSFDYKPGNFGGNALTLTATGNDVVGHHSITASIVADTNAPSPAASLAYAYGRLPVDLSVRAFHAVTPRGGFRINDKLVNFNEYATGLTTGVSLPVPGEFGTQGLGVSYSAAATRGVLPIGRTLDPYATTTVKPPEGLVGVVHFGYGFSNVEGSVDASGAVRGVSLALGVDYADAATASKYSVRTFEYVATAYLPMPWPGYHSVALRSSGGISGGDYPRGGRYFVGGYDLENTSFIDTVTTGVFNGAFVLRGYAPRSYAGRSYVLETAEYRFPIWFPDHGLSTLPIFLRRLDGNLFVDFGGAFDRLDMHAFEAFHDGALLYSPQLSTAIGAELWTGLTLGWAGATQLRLGYAYGFAAEAIPGGQLYFVAAGAF